MGEWTSGPRLTLSGRFCEGRKGERLSVKLSGRLPCHRGKQLGGRPFGVSMLPPFWCGRRAAEAISEGADLLRGLHAPGLFMSVLRFVLSARQVVLTGRGPRWPAVRLVDGRSMGRRGAVQSQGT
jgi:hypothetical protein